MKRLQRLLLVALAVLLLTGACLPQAWAKNAVFDFSAKEFYERLDLAAEMVGFKGEIVLTKDGDGDTICRFMVDDERIASLNFKDAELNWIPYSERRTQDVIHKLFLYGPNDAEVFVEAWAIFMLACDPTQTMGDDLMDFMKEMLRSSVTRNDIEYTFTDMSEETESFWVEAAAQ